MSIELDAHKMKMLSPKMAASSSELRNSALAEVAKSLVAHKDEIFAENKKDLENAEKNGLSSAIYKRLKFNEDKLNSVVNGINQLIGLPDPVGHVSLKRKLDEGLTLERVSCPIGVIGVIFEARPDAMVQISSLCIKSGNCAILKGGKETALTNKILFSVIEDAIVRAGLPKGALLQAEAHSEIDQLLKCDKDVDLLIPRGSNAFVQYIMNNTKIPVMGHADGICHVYVDKEADFDKAVRIVIDAKTQYTAACNAAETLLVDRQIASEFLPVIYEALRNVGVTLKGNEEATKIIDIEKIDDEDYATEYLDLIMSVKLVDGVEDAVNHINRFGSHHTDSIVTESADTAAYFMQMVDSAGVYQNASTRFADGFRYGFGAEVGISTSKIHARGPVGLEGLMTYKYKLFGNGHIVDDYESGRSSYKFQDMK